MTNDHSISAVVADLIRLEEKPLQESLEALKACKDDGYKNIRIDNTVFACLGDLHSLQDKLKALRTALLITYIKQQKEKEALDMIKDVADVNIIVSQGEPKGLLYFAIQYKMKNVILELLNRGAKVNEGCFIPIDKALKNGSINTNSWQEIVDIIAERMVSAPESVLTFRELSKLISWKSKKAAALLKKLHDKVANPNSSSVRKFLDDDLLSCNCECFQIFLSRFSKILLRHNAEYNKSEESWCAFAIRWAFQKHGDMDTIITNLNILLHSHIAKHIVANMRSDSDYSWEGFGRLLLTMENSDRITSEQLYRLVDCIHEAGIEITTDDMDVIYDRYGYESVFKSLLLRPASLDLSSENGNFPRFYYDVHWTIDSAVDDYLLREEIGLADMLGYFTQAQLKEIALRSGIESIKQKAAGMPTIPRLLELSRNTCRKYIVDTFHIQNCKELHDSIGKLPVANVYKKILLLERKIY